MAKLVNISSLSVYFLFCSKWMFCYRIPYVIIVVLRFSITVCNNIYLFNYSSCELYLYTLGHAYPVTSIADIYLKTSQNISINYDETSLVCDYSFFWLLFSIGIRLPNYAQVHIAWCGMIIIIIVSCVFPVDIFIFIKTECITVVSFIVLMHSYVTIVL